jgi:hypothetical protein
MLFKGWPVAVPISNTFLMGLVDYAALSPIRRYVALRYIILILLCEELWIDISID